MLVRYCGWFRILTGQLHSFHMYYFPRFKSASNLGSIHTTTARKRLWHTIRVYCRFSYSRSYHGGVCGWLRQTAMPFSGCTEKKTMHSSVDEAIIAMESRFQYSCLLTLQVDSEDYCPVSAHLLAGSRINKQLWVRPRSSSFLKYAIKSQSTPDSPLNASLEPSWKQVGNPDLNLEFGRHENAETHVYVGINVD